MEIKETKNHQSAVKPSARRSKKQKSKSAYSIQLALIIVLVAAGIYGLWQARGANSTIDQKSAEAIEAARPANLTITVITDKECTDCSNLASYISYLKEQKVNIEKEENLDMSESQAQALIKQYAIKKIPVIIISGEINKFDDLKAIWTSWGAVIDEIFVLTDPIPPYLDLDTNKVMGRVSMTFLTDKSCSECYDVTVNKNILANGYGVKVVNETTVDVSDEAGQDLIEKYNITKVPTFMVDNEVAVYQGLLSVWNSVGSIESDGMYVLRKVEQMGTYYDLEAKELIKPAAQTNTNTNSGS